MAIQFSEEMIARMGNESASQVIKMLEQMDKEIPADKFTVRLYKRFNFSEFYIKNKKTFDSLEEAESYLRYVSFEKFRQYDKGDIIDNKGIIHNEQYI